MLSIEDKQSLVALWMLAILILNALQLAFTILRAGQEMSFFTWYWRPVPPPLTPPPPPPSSEG